MQLYLGVLIFSFAVTSMGMVPFIGLLYRLKFTRQKETNELRLNKTPEFEAIRAKHALKAGTPTGLGIWLLIAITASFLLLIPILELFRPTARLISGYPFWKEVGVLGFTFISFAALGLYDDVLKIFGFAKTGFFGLRRKHKFIIQWILALCSAFFMWWGLGINIIHLPIFGIVHLGFGYVFMAAFLIVMFANAFDITSGLDGLGEGLLVICLLAFWVIAASVLDRVLILFIAVWIGAVVAGIYFTIYPARAFLGNASGMAFGSTLAMVGLLSGKFVPLLIVGGVFLIDGGSSMLQILSKSILKRRIFPIAPIHHYFEIVGWEEPKIVARAWLSGIVLAIFGVWLALL